MTDTGVRVDTGLVSGVLPFVEVDNGWGVDGVLAARDGGAEFPVVLSADRLQVLLVLVFRDLGRVESLIRLDGWNV